MPLADDILVAYTDTLDVLDGLPVIPMVATGWHWWSRQGAPIRLPRVSWMLRSLTLWHIDRVLSGAEGVFHRRSALGIAGAGEANALSAVAEFRASLPSRSKALRIGVLVIATLVVAHLLATLLLQIGTHHLETNSQGTIANQLIGNTLGSLQLTFGSIGPAVDNLVDNLFKASPSGLGTASPAAIGVLVPDLVADSECLPPQAAAIQLVPTRRQHAGQHGGHMECAAVHGCLQPVAGDLCDAGCPCAERAAAGSRCITGDSDLVDHPFCFRRYRQHSHSRLLLS